MQKKLIIVFCLVIITLVISKAVSAKEEFKLNVDWASFKGKGQNIYLELYYEISKLALTYEKGKDGKFTAEVLCHLQIVKPPTMLGKKEELIAQKVWRLNSVLEDTTHLSSQNDFMVDLLRFDLQPEKYNVKLSAKDIKNEESIDSVEIKVDAPFFSKDKVSLSSIQLSPSISKIRTKDKHPFHKNTYNIIPNPGILFGKERSSLFFYVESYNLDKSVTTDVYKTNCYISNSDGNRIDPLGVRVQKKKLVKNSVEVGMVNVASLATGKYSFHFEILDGNDEVLAASKKEFFVYNPVAVKHAYKTSDFQSEVMSSIFSDLSERELDNELQYIKYIAKKDENKLVKSIESLEGKKEFLWAFWKKRSMRFSHSLNSIRDNYLRKIEYANDKYRSMTRKGWKTERGRVYIQYDSPSDIDIFQSSDDSYSYEIWFFDHIENGAQFIFADRRGFGEWDLLHSTVIGEIKNDNWRNFLRK